MTHPDTEKPLAPAAQTMAFCTRYILGAFMPLKWKFHIDSTCSPAYLRYEHEKSIEERFCDPDNPSPRLALQHYGKNIPHFYRIAIFYFLNLFHIFDKEIPPTNKEIYNKILTWQKKVKPTDFIPASQTKWDTQTHKQILWEKVWHPFYHRHTLTYNAIQTTTWRMLHRSLPTA